jgi:hypothetical protein
MLKESLLCCAEVDEAVLPRYEIVFPVCQWRPQQAAKFSFFAGFLFQSAACSDE